MNSLVDINHEIVFGSSDSAVSRQISNLVSMGVLKKIAPRLYTTNLLDSPEQIIKRNILNIIMWRFPKMIISHRSANEMRLTPNGYFFITGNYNRVVSDLPGVTVVIMKGPPADEKDMAYGQMFIASEYRWMLENMQQSRKQDGYSKSLPVEVIERKLVNILLSGGDGQLNQYREQLRETATRLDMMHEFEKINVLISALLSTNSIETLTTPSAKAMAVGMPYDEERLSLFEHLFQSLQEQHFIHRPVVTLSEDEYRNVSFFESYFSNYIEGTEFSVVDAREIIETGTPMLNRKEDSHDILGTFQVVSNRNEMMKCPTTSQELLELLTHRHAMLLSGRPDLNPGQLKDRNNRAGNTEFVDAKLVNGTLDAGFGYYAALSNPIAKAIYMMFLISEVHPFNDGNGRIARVMMNAELFKAGESKIIVPTVYREDYLLALRKMSRQKMPETFIKVLSTLHLFSSNLYGRSFSDMLNYLKESNAFEDPNISHLKIIE